MSQQPVAWPSILIPILKYEILKYAILLLLLSTPAIAQQGATDLGPRLLQDAAVRAAVEAAERHEPQILEDQIRLCEIPAPPFKEQKRAEAYKQAFEELVNPIHALGRAIGAIADIQVPVRPKTTFNVGRIGGGRGSGAHSLGETFDATESWKGTQRAVLVAIALAQR